MNDPKLFIDILIAFYFLENLVKGDIALWLSYCSAFYTCLLLKSIWKLAHISTSGDGWVAMQCPCSVCCPGYQLTSWCNSKLRLLSFDTLNGIGPIYLSNRLSTMISPHPVRSGRVGFLWVLSIKDSFRLARLKLISYIRDLSLPNSLMFNYFSFSHFKDTVWQQLLKDL